MENSQQGNQIIEEHVEKSNEEIKNMDDKEYHFIYFIESHDKSKQFKIYLSPEYKDSNTLEMVEEKDSSNIRNSLISKLYRFKLFPDNCEPKKKDFNVVIIMEEKKEDGQSDKSEYNFKIKNIHKDFYDYNFKMENIDVIQINYEQQFEIFINFLRKKLKIVQSSKENEDFILSTQMLFTGNDKKFDFLFYLLVFLECFASKTVHMFLMSFKPEKINSLGNAPEQKIKQMKNILNLMIKKPEKIRVEKESSRKSITELFYFVVLYFNINFQKDKVKELLNDEKVFDGLCDKFFKYQNTFRNLVLLNEQICKLIEKSKDYNQVLTSLFYVGKNFVNFLKVINAEKDQIVKLREEEKEKIQKQNDNNDIEKKVKPIDLEEYILPRIEDNLLDIMNEIDKMKSYETLERLQLITFSPAILEQYVDFNRDINLQNLSYLNKIINTIKSFSKKFKIKYKMDSLIHETGIKLVKNGKLKNLELLEFISNDDFYQNKSYDNKSKIYRPLEVFDGIEISSLDDKFFNLWKKMNFKVMFQSNLFEFSEKIASLIKEMKDFGLLFKFFNVDIKGNEPAYEYIESMKKRFINLINTYSVQTCPNFIDDTAKLIYITGKVKQNIKKFLIENIQTLSVDIINKIYIKVSNSYNDLSKEIKDLIVEYFIKNSKPINLVYILKESTNIKNDIFFYLNKYIIKEFDFFSLNETDNYIFFKGLLDEKIIDKNSFQNNGITYLNKSLENILSLQKKIENFEINYSLLNTLLKFQKNDNILLDRIEYIYFLDKEKAQQIFDNLTKKIKQIQYTLKTLQLLLRYFVSFYPQSHKDDIKNIGRIISQLNNNNLNFFENNYKNDFDNYFINYYGNAIRRLRDKESTFFNEIYNNTKKKYKNDEDKCIIEAEQKFNEFKKLFEDNGIHLIDQDLLELCLKPFKKNENNLIKEIDKIFSIFDIKEKKDIHEIYEEINLISKREYIFNIALAINVFFQNLEPQKTNLKEDIDNLINSLRIKKDVNTIRNCKEILDKYNINIDEKENKYIDILIKLKEQPDSSLFLFKTSIPDCRNLQELTLESDDNFITVNDIMDMEKCVEFFFKLGKLEDLKKKTDIEIIDLLKENSSKHKDILVYFEKFISNYNQIKNLQASLNKSEVLKYQIQALFDGAIFTLSSNRLQSFICSYKQKDTKNDVHLKRENIIDLKERAQLSKKITSAYKCFIESVIEIINISNILDDISMKGYPEIINVKIIFNITKKDAQKNIKEEEEEYIINNDYFINDLKQNNCLQIIDNLQKILKALRLKQKNAYETKPLLRYVYGRQFNLLYEFFKNNNEESIKPFLKYLTNDLYKNNVKNFKTEIKQDIIESNINNCERFLNEVLKINNLDLGKIYQNTIIKNNLKEKFKGVYTFLCEKLEKDLFQIFKYLTGNNPIAQNILLCKKTTTNEEITSFLYRAIKCQFNSCFIIGGLESLEFEQKSYMIEFLDNLFNNEEEKLNSCIIFLYTNKSSDIYKNLEMKKYRDVLKIKNNNFEKIIYEGNDIEIIKSDKSGVGKSTQIKMDIKNNKKTYIYFPFGDVLNDEEIIKRLKELKLDRNCVIHLDLYDTDQISLMMDFLFSILITRFYGQNEDIFYLSKDIQIKIEIPNSFINFFEKFPFLTLFQVKEMKLSNLSPLLVPKELDSNIQIVANYLKSLKEKKIDDYDLIFPNVTPIDFSSPKRVIVDKKHKNGIKTAVSAKQISPQECQQLIFDEIKKKIPEPTYYQIISFINVLAIQLKKLNQNFFLNAYQLILTGKKINYIRTFIVESFIKITKHFTEGAFTNLLKGQENVHKSLCGIYDEGQDINNAVNNLANYEHEVISFDKIDPSLLFFHEGEGESFSIITNKNPNDKEYIDLLNLKNSQALRERDKIKFLPKYNDKKFEKRDFLEELKNILDIKNPVESGTGSEWKSLEEIAGNYVFTADNFVKMVLILLRIRSNIPVIMMGETGCGKTSLIRKLSEMKNNGESDKMKILNIHAGTNDNDIISFINKSVIPYALEIAKQNEIEKKIREKNKQLFEEVKIWVFLDEINTCKSMGLISELMCKHTCQGKPLPSNIVFIAACNPYRQRENKGKNFDQKIGLDINLAYKQKKQLNDKEREEISRNKNSNLVYTVNPLPHSLLNFVFDFGNLTPEHEEDYIRCIIKESIEKIYYKGRKEINQNDLNLEKLKKLAGDMIIDAHKFIRENNDRSAVSLREIRRFNIFYEFFYDYLNRKKDIIEKEKNKQLEDEDNNFYLNLDDYSIQVYSINLSIFVCYYLRITDKSLRNALIDRMNKIFQKFNDFNNINFIDLPIKEENFIVNNINLEKGIAKNNALLENIFSLFVAINNKVPIFIVGKPGCSKSLSFQLLNKSMQGSSSDSPFFKNYPKLMVSSYQGSLSSTSKGVENVFLKARSAFKKLSEEDKKKNISMIFFDEMGLAEHSPNNPLKVMHSELEYDQNEGDKKVAFVGISNWILDASKMNRGLSISIPEPNEEDNKETSLIIGKSYNENLAEINKLFFENLGYTYFKYKEFLKEKHNRDGKEDFHGNRDFYHLVKNASRNIIIKENNQELNDDTLLECGISSIERNFAGIQFDDNEKKTSLEIVKNIFKEKYPNILVSKEYNVLKRIKENINDLNSRYLLVISKSSISSFLLSSILSEENKEYSFYVGSKFEQDLNSEEYSLKVLNKIQTYMENGNILILNNLETVYPSMYDLFNQNFTVLGNKNYARLAVGSSINTFSLVNNNFRCIVNVDLDKIDNEEAPFLNRFEKHIMSFEYLLSKELIQLSQNIKLILDELIKYNENELKGINYDISKLLINCNIDEINALVYQANKEGKKDNEIIDFVLSKIALTLPQDILIIMKCNQFKQKYEKYFNTILDNYGKGEHTNLANFIKQIDNLKNVVYTFSNNLEKVKNIKNINNKKLGLISDDNIKKIKISSIKKENELEKQIDEVFNNDNYKICLIQFMPHEGDFMNYVKYFIENKEKNYQNKNPKCFIFVVYMSRILKDDLKNIDKKTKNEKNEIRKKTLTETLTNLSGYYQIFIDNLNGENNYKMEQMILMDNINLFKTCINFDKELTANIFTSISYLKYNIFAPYKGLNKDNYIKKLIEFISSHKRLRTLLNECLFKQTVNDKDPIHKIFKNKNIFVGDEIEILSLIKKNILKIYNSYLNILIFKVEKDQFFSSLLSNSIEQDLWHEEKNNQINNKEEIEEEMNLYNDKKDEKNENVEEKTLVEKIAKLYLEKLDFNDGITRITEKPNTNKVDIMLGFKLPGIKPIFDKILKVVRDHISNLYRKNENNLRSYLEGNLQDEIDKYFKLLNTYNNSTLNIISKEQKLLDILNNYKEYKDSLYDLIINDYYTLFLNQNINKKKDKKEENEENEEEKIFIIDNLDENKRFLNLMTKKRNQILKIFLKQNENEEESNIIKKIAIDINFIESYSEEITSLQKIFLKLYTKIPELYEQIEDIINKKQIQYEISKRNPEYTIPVNEVFFLSMDSILRIITSKSEIYDIKGQFSEDDLFDLINTYKEIHQDALQLENNLTLRSKEAFSLQEILKLFDAFNANKMANIENVKKIIEYFGAETQINNDNQHGNLCNKLEEFYRFLVDKLGKNKNFNFYKVLSNVFLNEYIKITFDDFRELLLQKILSNNDFIKNSSQVITIILENVIDYTPQDMEDNLNRINGEKSPMFRKINNTKNDFLDQVIMNIFEGKISIFFDLIPSLDIESMNQFYPKYLNDNKNTKVKNPTGIVFDNSFKIFVDLIKFLDKVSKNDDEKNNQEQNMHISKLYAIVYIKMFLSKLVYFIKEKYKELGDFKNIIEAINNINNKSFGNVIKIYIFKLFYNYLDSNYEKFKNFRFLEHNIEFVNNFQFDSKADESMLTYFFLPLDENDYNKYKDVLKKFEIMRNNKFNTDIKELSDILQKYGIDIFLTITINKIISNLGLQDYIQEKDEYQTFCNFMKSLFNTEYTGYKPNNHIINLLNLFYNDQIFIEKMKLKLLDENRVINTQLFEILLYGFRYCVNSLDNKNNGNYLYNSLLQKNYNIAIEKSYIPGGDIKEDLHISTLETIYEHFKNYQDSCGCYVCSCGYYYYIDPCGFPTKNRTSDCPVCHEKIGYGPKKIKDQGASNHGMILREGHYRIFRDAKQKVSQMSRWHDPDENIPNLLLDEYIKKVIEPIRKSCSFGFNSISRDYFENQKKKVRNLSNIGYRLLNFISYCHLFFSYCLGYIPENNLNKYLIQNMSILKIIQTDWNLLKESLQQKNIGSIQIFMNMIFKKLSMKIKNCAYLLKSEDRDKFEDEVEKLIEECIKEYPKYFITYNEKNKEQLNFDNFNMKTIVTELLEPIEENYPEKNYPFFRYFILTKYKTEDDFVKRMEQKPKYPLVNQLLQDFQGVKKLKYLPQFNEFTNYMVEYYSFKISRDDARKRILKEEKVLQEKGFDKKFKNFLSAWNEIKVEAKKYKCRPEMQVKNLDINEKLIYFLNDCGELGFGMYLAAACQNFIEWQNTFLQPIVDANAFNGILHNYVDTIQKKIPVQDAKPGQILLLEQRFGNTRYANLNDIIYSFSQRHIFNENGTINYSDYNSFEYDYDAIEEELGKIILPGVCLFEGEDELNFVTFWSEGFRGARSQILSNFYLKYPQKDLNNQEKENVMKYIDDMNKEKMAKYNMKYDFKEFFGSIQIIIFYLTEQLLMKEDSKILDILNSAPSYLKISDDCRDFFSNNGSEITVQKLMNLFFFFEHLCFEDLSETLQPEYKKEIPEDKKNEISNKLLKNYNNKLFTIKDLGAAVRRFISRYLVGRLQTTDVNEDRDLTFELSREDLWEEKIGKDDDLMEKLGELLSDFKLTVGQAFSFYKIIGIEDSKSIETGVIDKQNDKYDAINILDEIIE